MVVCRRWRWGVFVLIMPFVAYNVACTPKAQKPSEQSSSQEHHKKEQKKIITVTVETLVAQHQPQYISLNGRTKAFNSADVRPQITGIIRQVLFKEGDMVRAGQALFKLDENDLAANVNSSKATLAKYEATKAALQAKLKRYESLLSIEAVSQQEIDDIRAQVQVANADIALAKAQLQAANTRLGLTVLRAPISGKTGALNATIGSLVTANQAQSLVQIEQLSPMYLDLTQSSDDYLKWQHVIRSHPSAIKVHVLLPDNQPYVVAELLPTAVQVNSDTAAVLLRARFNNTPTRILPNMFVSAKLVLPARPVLTVPQTAVKRNRKGESVVYTLDAEQQIQENNVVLGAMDDTRWEVVQGLEVGQRLVVSSLQNLKAGMKVKVAPVSKPEERQEREVNNSFSTVKP